MPVRRAGEHARKTARGLAVRWIAAVAVLVIAGGIVGSIAGFASPSFVATELMLAGCALFVDRRRVPVIGRWARGAAGEEQVGAILDGLAGEGWLATHDAQVGHGNIDHVLVGTGGVLTLEVKSHGGRIVIEAIDEKMLSQAWRHAYALRDITGRRDIEPLLVFSRAYLDRPGGKRKGVQVLPARMLARHLARRAQKLSRAEAVELHAELLASLALTGRRAA